MAEGQLILFFVFVFFFLFPHLLSRARLLINVWAELESTRLNVFIFLGEVQGRGSEGGREGGTGVKTRASYS